MWKDLGLVLIVSSSIVGTHCPLVFTTFLLCLEEVPEKKHLHPKWAKLPLDNDLAFLSWQCGEPQAVKLLIYTQELEGIDLG